MLNPPQRSSLWRFRPWKKDKTIPKNLEDYGLNCGGFWRLHGVNKGKCGVCGDPYDAMSRQNEAGGKFANGIIVRRYRQNRKYINVTIDITANIGGHFEFRLCPNNNVSAVVTQECLDKHRLTIEGHGLEFKPDSDSKFMLALHMPPDVSCTQCVLQWKWRGSYNWGVCDDGYQDVGCGNQEEYYNCADIAILPSKRQKTEKKPEQQTDQWDKIVNEDVTDGDETKTILPSKDVKTMSKDVSDIKSIDIIYNQSNNLLDPTEHGQKDDSLSGIPVYMFKDDLTTVPAGIDVSLVTSTNAPPQDKVITELGRETPPPPIIVDSSLDHSGKLFFDPVLPSVTNAKQNTIYDLTSVNSLQGVNQDLVQSPGNNIFNKAQWIEDAKTIEGFSMMSNVEKEQFYSSYMKNHNTNGSPVYSMVRSQSDVRHLINKRAAVIPNNRENNGAQQSQNVNLEILGVLTALLSKPQGNPDQSTSNSMDNSYTTPVPKQSQDQTNDSGLTVAQVVDFKKMLLKSIHGWLDSNGISQSNSDGKTTAKPGIINTETKQQTTDVKSKEQLQVIKSSSEPSSVRSQSKHSTGQSVRSSLFNRQLEKVATESTASKEPMKTHNDNTQDNRIAKSSDNTVKDTTEPTKRAPRKFNIWNRANKDKSGVKKTSGGSSVWSNIRTAKAGASNVHNIQREGIQKTISHYINKFSGGLFGGGKSTPKPIPVTPSGRKTTPKPTRATPPVTPATPSKTTIINTQKTPTTWAPVTQSMYDYLWNSFGNSGKNELKFEFEG